MYQVRAEAVNGLQVLSKGRWLTCIGNKPVRKGDLVWTDGRCVYGFYREGQTPLVILNPVEDCDIPIYIYTKSNSSWVLEEYFYKNGKIVPSVDGAFNKLTVIVDNKTYPITKSAQTLSPINVAWNNENDCYLLARGHFNQSEKPILAMNYDSDTKEFCFIQYGNNRYHIQISSNNIIVRDIDIYARELHSILKAEMAAYENVSWINWGSTQLCTVIFSFIENVNNWFFVVACRDSYYSAATLFRIYSSDFEEITLYNQTFNKSMDTSAIRDIKFPIQDGYYFQIESNAVRDFKSDHSHFNTADWEFWEIYPMFADISIHSPNDTVIFRGNFPLFPYFTIYKIASNRFLIGVCVKYTSDDSPRQWFVIESSSTRFFFEYMFLPSNLNYYAPGLYMCEDGELKPLLVQEIDNWEEDDVFGVYARFNWCSIINQRFTPIKYKKINYITRGGDRI